MVFKKGQSGNPDGRPKGTKNKWSKFLFEDLLKEMRLVEKNEVISKGRTVLAHFVERAYKSDNVLNSLMKKLVADKKEIDAKVEEEVIVVEAEEPTEEETLVVDKEAEKVRKSGGFKKETEIENFTDEQWLDYIKRIRANKKAKEK